MLPRKIMAVAISAFVLGVVTTKIMTVSAASSPLPQTGPITATPGPNAVTLQAASGTRFVIVGYHEGSAPVPSATGGFFRNEGTVKLPTNDISGYLVYQVTNAYHYVKSTNSFGNCGPPAECVPPPCPPPTAVDPNPCPFKVTLAGVLRDQRTIKAPLPLRPGR